MLPLPAQEFEAFCRKWSPRLVSALSLQCGDREVGRELAQDALVRAWERWAEVSAMENPSGWLFRVAFNLRSSRLRRARAESRVLLRVRSDSSIQPPTSIQITVRDALQQLPVRQRAALVARHYLQLSVNEAAEALDCAPGTVKALCSQGIERLREELEVDVQVAVNRAKKDGHAPAR